MLAGTDPHLFDVEEINELLEDVDLLAERDVTTLLAAAAAVAEQLTPAQRHRIGRLLEARAAVSERHAAAAEIA